MEEHDIMSKEVQAQIQEILVIECPTILDSEAIIGIMKTYGDIDEFLCYVKSIFMNLNGIILENDKTDILFRMWLRQTPSFTIKLVKCWGWKIPETEMVKKMTPIWKEFVERCY